jgi:hypothetical protein
MSQIKIAYSLLSSVEEQLEQQGYTLGDRSDFVDKTLFYIKFLAINSFLTEKEEERATHRLHKYVMKHIKEKP